MATLEDSILLVKKDNERSTLWIAEAMYQKNKSAYDAKNYKKATKKQVEEYLKKRGIKLQPTKSKTESKSEDS